jgi:hypothetical protein
MSTRRLAFTVAVGLLLLLGACGGGGGSDSPSNANASGASGAASVQHAISGVVLDLQGRPLAGVTVNAYHHNDHTTKTSLTDSSGSFTIAGLDTVRNADYAIYATGPGLGFAASVSDAAVAVTPFDFDGLYRGVARFATLPGRDVQGVNFTGVRAGERLVSLPRTGQSLAQAAGDDADAARGVAWPAQRYTDNQDGSVRDNLTGLVWLKDAGCLVASDWSTALAATTQLAAGRCGLSDGSTAGQWRMPNINELESLVDVSQASPALTAGHPFLHVDLARAYWSSTTYNALNIEAHAIRFTDGRWINGPDPAGGGFDNAKATAANATWAVRSGSAGLVRLMATGAYDGVGSASYGAGDDPSLRMGVALTSPRFVDQGDGTVADTMTGLVWMKQADCLHTNWRQALQSVNALAAGQCGLTDGSQPGQWRLPNRNELLSLSDRAPSFPQADYLDGRYRGDGVVTGPVIFSSFVVSMYYWSSTTDAADTSQSWGIYSCDFGIYNLSKDAIHYALAVR